MRLASICTPPRATRRPHFYVPPGSGAPLVPLPTPLFLHFSAFCPSPASPTLPLPLPYPPLPVPRQTSLDPTQVQFYVLLPMLLLLLSPRSPGFVGRIAAAAATLWATSLAFRRDAVWRYDLRLAPPIYMLPGDDGVPKVHAHFVSFNKYIYMSSVSHCLTPLPRDCKADACKRESMVTCV